MHRRYPRKATRRIEMLPAFLRNLGLLAVAQMVARARGIILLPILSRALGTTDFGTWAQVSVVVFALTPFVMLGTENGMLRLIPGLAVEAQRRRYTAWVLFTVGAAVAAALLITLARGWLANAFLGCDVGF